MRKFNAPFIILIKFYRKIIAPLLPRVCRFEPSCSVYAQHCYERFSWHRATHLTAGRLLRCHPWCEGGFDAVPEIKTEKVRMS